ncbi:nitroreductase family protein [Candidatus Poriferisodalis sp.]|uniref:nitroreductase family protein n=1 Tax=Candidatus Poriferisodalis sp. TaxID=3101277 RepID=UPI003B02C295
MDIYDVMRTTFAARDFTDDDVPDEVLHRIFDHARFAASGGNRQGWKITVVRDPQRKQRLGELCIPAMRVAVAQRRAGEVYWQSYEPSSVNLEEAMADESLPTMIPMFTAMDKVPVVLVATVDLREVASIDKEQDRIGVVSGASIYPLVWNILLGARNEGYGGALTTLVTASEPAVKDLLGLDDYEAVCALMPLGKPTKQLTKLSRKPVEEFVRRERADGAPFTL